MRKRTEKNGKPPSKPWLSPSSRYACAQLLLAGIVYPKHCFAGGHVHVQTHLSSGCSHVEEKRFVPSFLNWDLVQSPALLLQRPGFLDAFYMLIQILLGKQLGFFPWRESPVGFSLGSSVPVPLVASSHRALHFSRALVAFLYLKTP